MKKMLLLWIAISLSSLSAMASSCHFDVGYKILNLSEDAQVNKEISKTDLKWVEDNLIVAVSRADNNNFSCSSLSSLGVEQTVVSSLLLNMSSIPKNVVNLLMRNNELLLKMVEGMN